MARLNLWPWRGASDSAGAANAFGERPVTVRTAVFGGKEPAIASAEDGDFIALDAAAPPLPQRNFVNAAETWPRNIYWLVRGSLRHAKNG